MPPRSIPISQLRDRSGSRPGLPVTNPCAKFSKNVGSLNPVPIVARSRVAAGNRYTTPARYVPCELNCELSSNRPPSVNAAGPQATRAWGPAAFTLGGRLDDRSEEHTSELQSL